MNTGDRLVELSGLSPRTAFDHFMSIVTGGVNKTLFASQMTVSIESESMTLVRYQKRESREVVPTQAYQPAASANDKRITVFSAPASIHVFTAPEAIHIRQARTSAVSVRTAPKQITSLRKRTVNYF